MIIDPRVQVLTRKEDLDPRQVADRVFIVLDILFATSTIVAALAEGARSVLPAVDAQAARDLARTLEQDSFLLAGEHLADAIEGFAAPTPLALLERGIVGRDVVYSTTNGTVALERLAAAEHVYAGALLNAASTVKHVLAHHPGQRIVVVCSGSVGHFNLEDWYGAGCFIDLIATATGNAADLSDAARAARMGYRAGAPLPSLLEGRVGRLFSQRGLAREIEYASRCSIHDVVVRREGSALVRAPAAP
jgi:2-phosphosulfolactate phosphatase